MVCCHLAWKDAGVRQAQAVVARTAAAGRVVWVGDLNARPDSAVLQNVALAAGFEHVRGAELGQATYFPRPNKPCSRYDYILCRGVQGTAVAAPQGAARSACGTPSKGLCAENLRCCGSDHRPVVADVEPCQT